MRQAGPDVLRAAEQTLVENGWSVRSAGGGLDAREDPARLHCHCWPAEVRVQVDRSESLGTVLKIRVKVPGLGPISGRHASEQLALVSRLIDQAQTGALAD